MARSAEQTLAERLAAALEVLAVPFPRWRRKGRLHRLGGREGRPGRPPAAGRGPGGRAPDARLRWQGCGRRGGRYVFAADGSRVSARAPWPTRRRRAGAGRQKSGPADKFLTTLWHMGPGAALRDYRIGPGTASERRHLVDMLGDLPRRRPGRGRRRLQRLRPVPPPAGGRRSFLLRALGSNVHLLRRLGYAEREGRTPSTCGRMRCATRPAAGGAAADRAEQRGKDKAYLGDRRTGRG